MGCMDSTFVAEFRAQKTIKGVWPYDTARYTEQVDDIS